ncbi:MAG: primase-helicase family protein [Sulfitobacter sp.]
MTLGFENHPHLKPTVGPSALSSALGGGNLAVPTTTWNDAIIYGDISSEEAQKVLASELITGFSDRAPKVAGDKWIQKKFRVRDVLETLTRHPVQKDKEGTALFFNETELTGRARTISGERLAFTYRGKAKAKSVSAFVVDIDGTDHIERVRDAAIELGLFAVLYTTHSHAEKSTEGGDFFRLIIPLEYPFLVEKHGGNPRLAAWHWLSRYVGFSKLLGIKDFDLSAAKFVQMMYMPRRAEVDAAFKHYVVAGRALSVDEMPIEKDIPKFKAVRSAGRAREPEGAAQRKAATLGDGFDVRDWFDDCGDAFDLETFLDMIGWDIRNEYAGDGMTIMCPNHLEHTDPDDGSDTGCWCAPTDGEQKMLIMCHHDHCGDLCTWDFIRLMEDRIEDGDAVLPDEFNTLSELLCDEMFYPEIDGKTITVTPADYGAVIDVAVSYLTSPKKVEDAFLSISENDNSGEADYVALFAGVALADNRSAAVERLRQLLKDENRFNANEIANLKKRGAELAKEKRKEYARQRDADNAKAFKASSEGDADLGHPSWDIADPLGGTMKEALATLAKRWRVVSIGGKFRVLCVPDPEGLTQRKVAIETMSTADFEAFHENRKALVGKEWVNPAKAFVKNAPRLSSIEFAPPPVQIHSNVFNLYRGRQINPRSGSCEHLKAFIKHTVCRGREELFRFVWLYLAHLVQRPGEKPQTAIVLRGMGGCGKSTFGLILERLAAPYSLTIAEEEHVTGRFAGQHLATSLVAVCTEALFAGDPKVNGKIKSLVTSETILAEPKGLPVVPLQSYTRFYFDSNNQRVVPIDGNGSERRYLVMEVNDDRMNDTEYFDPIYAELNGDGIAALAWELESYDPATDGLRWQDVRTAPDTPERRKMRWHSMRPVERALLRLIEDGGVTMKTESGQTFRYKFEVGQPIRLPQAELRRFLGSSINRHEAKEGDIESLMKDLFGETVVDQSGLEHVTVNVRRPSVECCEYIPGDASGDDWSQITRKAIRCFEFPPVDVLREIAAQKYQLT